MSEMHLRQPRFTFTKKRMDTNFFWPGKEVGGVWGLCNSSRRVNSPSRCSFLTKRTIITKLGTNMVYSLTNILVSKYMT